MLSQGNARDAQRPLVVAVLTAAMGLAALPATAIGVLAPFLIADLGVDRAGIGALAALTSGVAALLSPLSGRIVDRLGDRLALAVVVGTGIAGLAGMAAAWSWPALCVALAIGAVCRAGSNPATNRVITTRIARGRRGWITGVKQSGETLAVVAGASLLPALALATGWRAALLILGLAACPALVAALSGLERGGAGSPAVPVTRGRVTGTATRPRVRVAVYWLMGYSFAMGAGGGCVTAYLPLFAHQSGRLGVAAAGGVMVLAGIVATIARVAWSRAAEAAPSTARALAQLAALAVLGTVVLIGATLIGSGAIWAGAALWGASGLGFGSVCMLAVMEESDAASTGKGTGLVVFAFAVGSTLTPPVFGWLLDATADYRPGLWLVAAFYVLAAVVILAGRSHFGQLREAAVT